jgi:sulfur carrier protein
MKVVLRNPRREVEVDGVTTVRALLARLDIVSESVLVICNDELVTHDARLAATDVVELRPVVSGGAQ